MSRSRRLPLLLVFLAACDAPLEMAQTVTTPTPDAGHSTVEPGSPAPRPGAPSTPDPTPDAGAGPDAGITVDAGTTASLDVKWIHGSANCVTNTDPPLQVVRYDADTFVLRQNKCINYEAPFIYVLFGAQKVFIQDTGATANAARFPIRQTIQGIITQRLAERGQASIEIVVTHSHAHGDHVAGDAQFSGQPGTSVVGTTQAAVQAFFQIQTWPTQTVGYELGGRTLEIIPIPGHEASHVAVYDPRTQWLLTGDTLYPGRLYVRDWAAYRASVARLITFSQTRPISRVMGTHVEMTSTPRVDYPIGTTYQPNEHPLQLSLADLQELNAALIRLGATPTREVHDRFIIAPN